MSRYLDTADARRPGLEQRRVKVDYPAWIIDDLGREAARLGVARQSLMKIWTAGRLARNTTARAGEPANW